jgi:hypothetical protein
LGFVESISGLPTALISLEYTESPLPPTTHHRPSLVANVADGTTPEMVEPEGSRSTFFFRFRQFFVEREFLIRARFCSL